MKDTRTYILMVFGALFLILCLFFAFFAWGAYQHYHSKAIDIEKIQLPKCLNLTSKLKQYPLLQKAINLSDERVDLGISPEELSEFKEVFNSYSYLEVDGKYYRIDLVKEISVKKLKQKPENYTRVSSEELESYPFLKDMINKAKAEHPKVIGIHLYLGATVEELHKAKEFVEKRGSIIEFDGGYYELVVRTELVLTRFHYPSDCMSVTEQQLINYPTLKKALELADKSGSAILDAPPEEWKETASFIQGCIEYNGSYYRVGFMTA